MGHLTIPNFTSDHFNKLTSGTHFYAIPNASELREGVIGIGYRSIDPNKPLLAEWDSYANKLRVNGDAEGEQELYLALKKIHPSFMPTFWDKLFQKVTWENLFQKI